jgi:CRISPR-associated protein Cas2
MALNERRTWIIAYDIRDKRRLVRVHAYLRKRAVPLQYSVFVARATANAIRGVLEGLREIVDEGVDDVRIYQLPGRPSVATLGRRMNGGGVQVLEGDDLVALLGLDEER